MRGIIKATVEAAILDLIEVWGIDPEDGSATLEFRNQFLKDADGIVWVKVRDSSSFPWEGWVALRPEGPAENGTRTLSKETL